MADSQLKRKGAKPGPKRNPLNKTNLMLAKRDAKKEAMVAALLDPEECEWETGKRGALRQSQEEVCCGKYECSLHLNSPTFKHTVSRLREYYLTLNREGRRAFYAARTHFNPPKKHYDLHGMKCYTHFIEKPDILAQRFLDMRSGRADYLREPHHSETIPCCGAYFRFITGSNKDTLHQWRTVRNQNPGSSLTLNDLALSKPLPARKTHEYTSDHNRTGILVVKWLEDAAESALHLANEASSTGVETVILPWWNRHAAHAAFVQECELIQKVPWVDDIVPVARHRGKKSPLAAFRYGNPLLGVKKAVPEAPGIASYGFFCRVWKSEADVRHIQLRKYMPFAKCSKCVAYRQTLAGGKRTTRQSKTTAREEHKEHIQEVKLERRHYYSNRLRAELNPETYLSLIIDGADQSKHKVPHDPDTSHLLDETHRQQLYAYGALSHGRKAYTYLIPGHVKQGHDITIEVLWQILNDMK
jgi:hypothetical protein